MQKTSDQTFKHKRFRLLFKLEAWLEGPMFVLSVAWLYLFIAELINGLTTAQENLALAIWIAFIVEFLIKVILAEHKIQYLKKNWLTVIALFIPAFRAFRLLRAIRILRLSRVATTTTFVRGLTSSKRFLSNLKEAQGNKPDPEIHVGVVLAHSQAADKEQMNAFMTTLIEDTKLEMEAATELPWTFHQVESTVLDSDKSREPSDFLDTATMRMAEGPYDLMVVVTDVALLSRRNHVVSGLASPASHVAIVSTRRLTSTPRGEPVRDLADKSVRTNAAALLLHLLGHISGLSNGRGSGAMAPFSFRERRDGFQRFNEEERAEPKRNAKHLPERELRGGTGLEAFIFHILMGAKHPKAVLRPLLRNWAILLPLSLPGLATAAIAPSIVLIFAAETWDVGLNMTNGTAAFFASISILGASFYLIKIQTLFLPRKEKNILTEHLAIANVVIFISILLACFGLFIMVGGLMLVIELYIFPEDLISTWPTLNKPIVTLGDKVRMAAFISTIGVTTGALAGGLEKKTIIQHLALFEDRP